MAKDVWCLVCCRRCGFGSILLNAITGMAGAVVAVIVVGLPVAIVLALVL